MNLDSLSISASTVVSASTEQVSSELAGETVVLDLNRGVYHGLDPVGSRIWQLLQQQRRSIGEIRDAILAEYDVEAQRCENDVIALVRRLAEQGLVTICDKETA